MDSDEHEHNIKLRRTLEQRLRKFELQAASQGTSTPPHVQLEIEQLRLDIAQLTLQINGVKAPVSTTGTTPLSILTSTSSVTHSSNNQRENHNLSRVILIGLFAVFVIVMSFIFINTFLIQKNNEIYNQETAVVELQATTNLQNTTIARLKQATQVTPMPQTITVTQQIIITPTPNSNFIRIEDIPNDLYSYNGDADSKVKNGSGRLVVSYRQNTVPSYRFDYTIPTIPQGDFGFAGFVFLLSDTFNFEEYDYIECTITYMDNNSKAQIGLKDVSGNTDYIRLVDGFVGGKEINAFGDEKTRTVQIPIEANFESVNKKLVKEITFSVNAIFTKETHTFVIQNIRLIRKGT